MYRLKFSQFVRLFKLMVLDKPLFNATALNSANIMVKQQRELVGLSQIGNEYFNFNTRMLVVDQVADILHSVTIGPLLGIVCNYCNISELTVIVQLGPRSKQSLSLKVWTKDEH